MCDDIARMGGDNGKFTSLIWPLTAEDPDDAFSSVPYEKVSIYMGSPISCLFLRLFNITTRCRASIF